MFFPRTSMLCDICRRNLQRFFSFNCIEAANNHRDSISKLLQRMTHLDLITIHSHLLTLTSGLPQVFKHERLGQSRDEFLELNAPRLSICSHAIVILSDTAASSLFVYNEVLLADWLGKSFVVVMVTNSWDNLRPNMQAILGICPAVDFECRPFEESMEILLYHLKPFRNMPAVILEQEFLDRMKEGLRPLRVLAAYHGKLCQSK